MTDIRERTRLQSLPLEYSQDDVEEVVRTALAEVDSKFRLVADRMDNFEDIPLPAPAPEPEPETLFGKVSTSPTPGSGGTIPAPSNQALSVGLTVLPAVEDAIELRLAPNRNRDNWASTTSGGVAYTGPRRIWKVTRAPKVAAQEGTASVRYRMVVDNLRFGVMCCRFLDEFANVALNNAAQTGSRWEVSYGLVITGIPNALGRRPVRATVDYGPNSPAAQRARNNGVLSPAWHNGQRDFYEESADDYFSGARGKAGGGYSSGAPVTNFLEPAVSYTDTVEGFTVMLISGETADEVYAQVNGLESPNLPFIGGRPRGLNAIIPYFSESNGITVPSVTAAISAAEVETRLSSTFTTTDAVVEGVPFLYPDCQAMAYKGSTFSVAIVIDPPWIRQWSEISGASGIFAAPTDEMRPAMWHTTGVEISTGEARTMTLDLIVE